MTASSTSSDDERVPATVPVSGSLSIRRGRGQPTRLVELIELIGAIEPVESIDVPEGDPT